MRSPSVTTISDTCVRPECRSISGMNAMSSGVIHSPRGRRRMWLNRSQASPTVGV